MARSFHSRIRCGYPVSWTSYTGIASSLAISRAARASGTVSYTHLTLPTELRSSMDSSVADIANIGERFGGMLVAGLFLAEFVPDRPGTDGDDAGKVPWAHLDIAGPAFNTGAAHGYTPVGGTGVAVRTLLGLVEDVAAAGV